MDKSRLRIRLVRTKMSMLKYRSLRGRTMMVLLAGVVSLVICLTTVYRRSEQKSSDFGSEAVDQLDQMIPDTDSPSNVSMVTWADKRKSLLSVGVPIKVFLMTYMRGGSSTAGEIFNQDPRAAMWYEPGASYYMAYYGLAEESFPQHDLYFKNMTRRVSSVMEQSWLVHYYTKLLTCQYRSLPPEVLGHWFVSKSAALSEYTTCMGSNIARDYSLNRCIRLISPICGTTAESSLQQNCHMLIETTRLLFRDHPDIVEEMMQGATDLFQFSTATDRMVTLLGIKLGYIGYFTPLALNGLKWFVQHRLCLESMRANIQGCLDTASTMCAEKDIHVVQVNRMNMEDLGQMIEANPDIYVVHVIRDPRAIALSRVRTDHLVWDLEDKRPQTEARIVCDSMAQDLYHRRQLEEKYPGVFLQVKYEQLVSDPAGVAKQIYSQFGREPADQWLQYAERTMHAAKDGGLYDHELRDAVNNANKWVQDIPRSQIDEIQDFCGALLTSTEYPILE